MGELQFHFLRKLVVPAPKGVGAGLMEFVAPEIGEVSGKL